MIDRGLKIKVMAVLMSLILLSGQVSALVATAVMIGVAALIVLILKYITNWTAENTLTFLSPAIILVQLNPCVYGGADGECDVMDTKIVGSSGMLSVTMLEDENIRSINLAIMSMLQAFYILAIILLGAYLMFMSGSPHGRNIAKDTFIRLIVGMLLVSQAPILFQFILDTQRSIGSAIINVALEDGLSGVERMIKFHNDYKFCCFMLSTAFFLVVGVLLAAMRYFLVFVMASFFPLTLFMYFTDIPNPFFSTRGMGVRLLRFTILLFIIQLIQVGFLTLAILFATTEGLYFMDFLLMGGAFLGIVFSPLIGLKLMAWVGAVMHVYSTRGQGNLTRFVATWMRTGSLADSMITASGQFMIGHNMGAHVGGEMNAPASNFRYSIPNAPIGSKASATESSIPGHVGGPAGMSPHFGASGGTSMLPGGASYMAASGTLGATGGGASFMPRRPGSRGRSLPRSPSMASGRTHTTFATDRFNKSTHKSGQSTYGGGGARVQGGGAKVDIASEGGDAVSRDEFIGSGSSRSSSNQTILSSAGRPVSNTTMTSENAGGSLPATRPQLVPASQSAPEAGGGPGFQLKDEHLPKRPLQPGQGPGLMPKMTLNQAPHVPAAMVDRRQPGAGSALGSSEAGRKTSPDVAQRRQAANEMAQAAKKEQMRQEKMRREAEKKLGRESRKAEKEWDKLHDQANREEEAKTRAWVRKYLSRILGKNVSEKEAAKIMKASGGVSSPIWYDKKARDSGRDEGAVDVPSMALQASMSRDPKGKLMSSIRNAKDYERLRSDEGAPDEAKKAVKQFDALAHDPDPQRRTIKEPVTALNNLMQAPYAGKTPPQDPQERHSMHSKYWGSGAVSGILDGAQRSDDPDAYIGSKTSPKDRGG